MAKKLIIAEDEEHVAKIIQFKLGKAGYEILHFPNGKDALAAISDEKPDLIMLDIMMPGLNGFEVLEAVKSNPETKNIPVVMLTAMGQEDDIVKGFDLGAVDYIVKPFRPAELLSRINRILQ